MTYEEALSIFRQAVDDAGGQRAFARQHGFNVAYIHDILHGKRNLSDRILATVGLRKNVLYVVTYQSVMEDV